MNLNLTNSMGIDIDLTLKERIHHVEGVILELNTITKAIENTITESQVGTDIWLDVLRIISKTSLTGFFTKEVSEMLYEKLMGDTSVSNHILDIITELRYNFVGLGCSEDEISRLIYDVIGITYVKDKSKHYFVNNKVVSMTKPIILLVDDPIYMYLFIIRLNLTHFLRCISRVKLTQNN